MSPKDPNTTTPDNSGEATDYEAVAVENALFDLYVATLDLGYWPEFCRHAGLPNTCQHSGPPDETIWDKVRKFFDRHGQIDVGAIEKAVTSFPLFLEEAKRRIDQIRNVAPNLSEIGVTASLL